MCVSVWRVVVEVLIAGTGVCQINIALQPWEQGDKLCVFTSWKKTGFVAVEWGRAGGRERKSVADMWSVLQIKNIYFATYHCVDVQHKLSTRPLLNCIFYLLFIPSTATYRSCGAEKKTCLNKGGCDKVSFWTACMSFDNNNMGDDGRPRQTKGLESQITLQCAIALRVYLRRSREQRRTRWTVMVDGCQCVSSKEWSWVWGLAVNPVEKG